MSILLDLEHRYVVSISHTGLRGACVLSCVHLFVESHPWELPNQMVVLPSFFVQRQRALFLPSTLLTFPSLLVNKKSVLTLALALLQNRI